MTGGGVTWTYTYDANGMRKTRSNGSTTYSYVYNGNKLSQMIAGGNTLTFTYDANGAPAAVTYNGAVYYYLTTLQGDVLMILDTDGQPVAEYTYDAWGRIHEITGSMAATLGQTNPLRYRGYVYDQETGLYYLNSRYYNPQWGRFLNADAFAATGQGLLGNNMFAYCRNNPVCRVDTTGMMDMSCLDDEHDKDLFPDDDIGNVSAGATGDGGSTNVIRAASGIYTQAWSSKQIGVNYTPKAVAQMANKSDTYHSFPIIVDSYIPYGKKEALIGGDGVKRTKVSIEGSVNGIDGVYEYIFEPDGMCNHRLFRPWQKG